MSVALTIPLQLGRGKKPHQGRGLQLFLSQGEGVGGGSRQAKVSAGVSTQQSSAYVRCSAYDTSLAAEAFYASRCTPPSRPRRTPRQQHQPLRRRRYGVPEGSYSFEVLDSIRSYNQAHKTSLYKIYGCYFLSIEKPTQQATIQDAVLRAHPIRLRPSEPAADKLVSDICIQHSGKCLGVEYSDHSSFCAKGKVRYSSSN